LPLTSCVVRRGVGPGTGPEQPKVGRYKGRVAHGQAKERRFRLLLFAALPDRVHGEVLSPLGGPQLILDGGSGQLAITFVRDGESFVGPARSEVLSRILGVEVELGQLVRALLLGEGSGGGLRVERKGPSAPGLPESLTIETEDATFALELKKLRSLGADPGRLGTGQPPADTSVRPLEDLEGEGERLERWADDGTAP
jgi:hypothetical protein